jgi:hypothetical protein
MHLFARVNIAATYGTPANSRVVILARTVDSIRKQTSSLSFPFIKTMGNDHHDDEDGSASSKPKMMKRGVVGIERFAHQKGVVKALHDFRERKEKKRLETAKSLRTYRKAMKKEGFEPGTGASRKRKQQDQPNEDGKDSNNNSDAGVASNAIDERTVDVDWKKSPHKKPKLNNNNNNNNKQISPERQQQRKKKVDPAVLAAERAAQLQERQLQEQKERGRALRRRRQRHDRLSARTSKGQPIMKNIVHDILDKLQKEKKQESTSSSK